MHNSVKSHLKSPVKLLFSWVEGIIRAPTYGNYASVYVQSISSKLQFLNSGKSIYLELAVKIMLKRLKTLHKPDIIYPTAGNPLLVLCDDLQEWVCKHSRDSSVLVNELLGSSFARNWRLPTPEISLISVEQEHIPESLHGINFKQSCFGSKFINNSKELDHPTVAMFEDYNFRRRLVQKEDFLLICLFDIWVANEDRTQNNMNLLLDFSDYDRLRFSVIDHDSIFNSNSLKRGLYQLNNFDSLLYSPLAGILYGKRKGLVNIVDNIVEKFYICVSNCEVQLEEIITLIPEDWKIDKEILEDRLRNNLFSAEWKKECENNFRSLVQTNLM